MLLMTIIFFIIIPVGSIPVILFGLVVNKRNYKIYTILLALCLAIIAYRVIPPSNQDLYRHFLLMDRLSHYSLIDMFSTKVNTYNPYLFSQNLVFYIIAKTGDYNILPAVSAFFTYICIIYMITDYSNRINASSIYTCIVLIFICFTLPFTSVISGIRYYWSVAFVLFAFYREYIENKRNILTYFIYLFAVFMHIAVLLHIAFRVLLLVYKSKRKLIINILLISWSLFAGIIDLFSKVINIGFLTSFFNRVVIYMNSSSDLAKGFSSLFYYQFNRIFFIILNLLILLSIYYINKKNTTESCNYNQSIIDYTTMFCCFALGCAPLILVFERFALTTILLSFSVILIIINRNNKLKYLLTGFMLLCTIYGSYCQYTLLKNFPLLLSQFPSVLIENLFKVLSK